MPVLTFASTEGLHGGGGLASVSWLRLGNNQVGDVGMHRSTSTARRVTAAPVLHALFSFRTDDA